MSQGPPSTQQASSPSHGRPARGTPTSRCIWAKHARGTARGGSPVLGSPIGSREFVATKLAQRLEEQDRLLSRIPHVPNLKSVWLLLLYCAAPRSTYLLRTLYTADFAASHDAAIQHCLAQMLAGGDGDIAPGAQPQASPTPPEHGRPGTGVCRSATPRRAFWPPFSARRWTRRPVEPPPQQRAAEQAARFLRSEGFPAPTWARNVAATMCAVYSKAQRAIWLKTKEMPMFAMLCGVCRLNRQTRGYQP